MSRRESKLNLVCWKGLEHGLRGTREKKCRYEGLYGEKDENNRGTKEQIDVENFTYLLLHS